MRQRIAGIFILLSFLGACKKEAPNPYYFNFQYQNGNYSFDSAFATIGSGDTITITAFDTRTKPPFTNTVQEQNLRFQLVSTETQLTGSYQNIPSIHAINYTSYSLFTGNFQQGSVMNGVTYYNNLPTLLIQVNGISNAAIQGSFSKNTNFNDSLIFLNVTNGKFNIPIR
jgi:hypothetical protein